MARRYIVVSGNGLLRTSERNFMTLFLLAAAIFYFVPFAIAQTRPGDNGWDAISMIIAEDGGEIFATPTDDTKFQPYCDSFRRNGRSPRETPPRVRKV